MVVHRSLLLLLLFPSVAGAPLLLAVVPDLPGAGPGDEAVALWGDGTDLAGWSLSDGEDSWPLPQGSLSGPGWFVGNSEIWSSFGGAAPAASGLSLRLGNDGDDVRLVDPLGAVVDSFAWGDGSTPGMQGSISYKSPGLVYHRFEDATGALVDTDTVADWQTPRMHRVGESSVQFDWMVADRVQPYACPDHCLRVWSDLLDSATNRAALHIYDLRAPWLADALVEAAGRVPLQVLVQDRPVGMDEAEQRERNDALRRIEAAGGEAVLASRGRYAYHHLKVLIVDDAVAIQSDNGVPSSFPQIPTWGSRGGGVVLHDAEIADAVWSVLAEDRAAWDVAPFVAGPAQEVLRFPDRDGTYVPVPLPPMLAHVPVRLVLTPDMTADPSRDPVLDLVRGAQSSVRVQQLDLRLAASNLLGWSGRDGLYSALLQADEQGATIAARAAAPFSRDDDGNRPVLSALAAQGIDAAEFGGPLWLHNKGVVVDDRWSYVGSMNQNHHSRSNNREFGVLLDSPEAAAWFGGLFDRDAREPQERTLEASSPPWPMLFAALLVLGVLRR